MTKDIEILKDGPVCKYYKNSILDEDVSWFMENRFEVFDINVKEWNKQNFHKRVKAALNFPDYYGDNLNAFADCLGDMFNTSFKGQVLVFRNFDDFLSNDHQLAKAMLDIIAKESRTWLVKEHKLISLIQSNKPHLILPELGGVAPSWNSAEWLNNERV